VADLESAPDRSCAVRVAFSARSTSASRAADSRAECKSMMVRARDAGSVGSSAAAAAPETSIVNLNKLLIRSSSQSIRTKENCGQLFEAAGLGLNQVISTGPEYNVIQGAPKEKEYGPR
jgi:hypothetical protein